MTSTPENLPDEIAALQAALAAERTARQEAEARAASAEALVAHYKLLIAKLKREQYGQSSERGRKLLDQLELQLEELAASAAEDDVAAAPAAATAVGPFTRRKPVRAPFPAHLPRERVVIPGPTACPCCGGKLAKLGATITETLEVVPRQWKVIQTVREKFTCRSCEKITQPPAPFHVIPRGHVGPSLLAMILYAKFGEHQPLNRQRELCPRGRRPGRFDAGRSRRRLHRRLEPAARADPPPRVRRRARPRRRHHGAAAGPGQDDHRAIMDPGLRRGRLYVRDDRPFAGPGPPAAVFFYSRNRGGEHPARHLAGYAGILQADAYAGFGDLYDGRRKPGPITEAACWSHGRRHFFEQADLRKAPLAVEAVRRIDALFDIERKINGLSAGDRLAARQRESKPVVAELEKWMRAERIRLSRHAETARAIDYMLTRWPAFTRFLDDSRICLTNNAAERALRGIALGRRAWLFAGSDRGGERAAAMYTLIATAKLNDVNPQAWLADVLSGIADHPVQRLSELLPWDWKLRHDQAAAA